MVLIWAAIYILLWFAGCSIFSLNLGTVKMTRLWYGWLEDQGAAVNLRCSMRMVHFRLPKTCLLYGMTMAGTRYQSFPHVFSSPYFVLNYSNVTTYIKISLLFYMLIICSFQSVWADEKENHYVCYSPSHLLWNRWSCSHIIYYAERET